MSFPVPHVIPPKASHKYTVILLHGRGSNGPDFDIDLLSGTLSSGDCLSDLAILKHCKLMFPSAPERFSTAFQESLPEWFDIYSLSDIGYREELQIPGLKESIDHIMSIIRQETQLVPADHIILGGISQGFAVAAHVLLASGLRFRGFFGFSGWLPLRAHLRDVLDMSNELTLPQMYRNILNMSVPDPTEALKTPVYISHSRDDSVIDSKLGWEAFELLKAFGMIVEYQEFSGGDHWIQEPDGYDWISNKFSDLLQ